MYGFSIAIHISVERVRRMEMEVVKLSSIVMRLTPELYPFLTPVELESSVILKFGLDDLDANGALEIIQQSICEQQKSAIIH